MISDYGSPDTLRGFPPLTFVKSMNTKSYTGLLNFCTTPNNVHDLMIEPNYLSSMDKPFRREITYRTVSVNDLNQSKALQLMWQKWLEKIAEGILIEKISI